MSWNIYFQAFTVRTWRKRLSNLNTFLTPHIYWGIHIKICVNYNQHREYQKRVGENNVVSRVAYEISVNKMEYIDDGINLERKVADSGNIG